MIYVQPGNRKARLESIQHCMRDLHNMKLFKNCIPFHRNGMQKSEHSIIAYYFKNILKNIGKIQDSHWLEKQRA